MEFKSVSVCGDPSIITVGSVPEKEGIPRMSTVGFAPGVPAETTVTPEALPCKASSALTGFSFSISAAFTVATAPDTLVTFCVPYPTTTTSFRACEFETIDTWKF